MIILLFEDAWRKHLRRICDYVSGSVLHVDDVASGFGLPKRSDLCSVGNGGMALWYGIVLDL